MQMIPQLPELALIVADAGYVGYEVTRALMESNVWFLIRMSCNATLFTEDGKKIETWTEGIVYYWPVRNRRRKDPPIRGRLIRVRGLSAVANLPEEIAVRQRRRALRSDSRWPLVGCRASSTGSGASPTSSRRIWWSPGVNSDQSPMRRRFGRNTAP